MIRAVLALIAIAAAAFASSLVAAFIASADAEHEFRVSLEYDVTQEAGA